MKKQVFNPYLPLNVCIPDGEPHVFGDRLYVFGSHEKEGDDKFCSLDYEFFSAPIGDLSDWSSKGINYSAKQDPNYGEKYRYMYAPDVAKGNDGRYYLYYAMSGGCFTGPIHVAVCNTPDGKYEYYGEVRNEDGSVFTRNITFDPAVMNDDGIIRLYYGWSLAVDPKNIPKELNSFDFNSQLLQVQMMIFGKTEEEIAQEPLGIMGAFTVQLCDDMLTVKTLPQRIVVGQFDSVDTEYDGHAFFEASSIRKIGDTYYFIYSSEKQHELCYATSKFPDREFRYGGVIVSNGDIGYSGRSEKDRLTATANNHGGIVNVNGQWYIFYHRHTHKTSFSRQACAEKIEINEDGNIPQVEITSCGLNSGALQAVGSYPAVICCNLTNGGMPHLDVQHGAGDIPFITHDNDERFISKISNNTVVGFKYFEFSGKTNIAIVVRGGEGSLQLEIGNDIFKKEFSPSSQWRSVEFSVKTKGIFPVYIKYFGKENIDMLKILFA